MAEPLLKPCQQDSGTRTSTCSLCCLMTACFSTTLRTLQVQGAPALKCCASIAMGGSKQACALCHQPWFHHTTMHNLQSRWPAACLCNGV